MASSYLVRDNCDCVQTVSKVCPGRPVNRLSAVPAVSNSPRNHAATPKMVSNTGRNHCRPVSTLARSVVSSHRSLYLLSRGTDLRSCRGPYPWPEGLPDQPGKV